MKRTEIEDKFKWDLTAIYKTQEDYDKDFRKLKSLIPQISDYKGIFLNDVEKFLEFMALYEKISRLFEKLSMYSHLYVDVEPDNEHMQELDSNIQALYELYSNETLFINIDIINNDEKVKKLLQDKRVEGYANFFNQILRYKPHTLDEKTEAIINMAENAMNSYGTYSAIKPTYKPVIIDGKEHFLNDETLREFLKNPDEEIRKQAYNNLYSEYKKFANIYASTLEGKMKEDVFYSKVKKYSSALEASTFGDEVTPELFHKILEMANEKYHSYFIEYMELTKKLLNKDVLQKYDLRLPLVEAPNKKYTLDDAFELIFKATENFGAEYREILKKARTQKWIDYMPHEGKRQGAYSSGCYDTYPYILASFTSDLESVFTLIHELGHSVHSYLSNHNQRYIDSDYRIFVAEVASTVNENLLIDLLIKNAKTKEEKAYLLYRKLQDFIGTCYRQPFFAKFEHELHEKVEKNEGLSAKTITDIYEKFDDEYYGKTVESNEYSKYTCFAVPHFYYFYYVYKYTIGNCVASVIASRVAKNDKEQIEKYLNFLKSGSLKSPVELLKDAGVNPLEDKLYDEAFKNFKNDLDEFKKIML